MISDADGFLLMGSSIWTHESSSEWLPCGLLVRILLQRVAFNLTESAHFFSY